MLVLFLDRRVSDIASPSTATISAAAAACTGSTYIVVAGDTCLSIATSHGIATDRFIVANGIDYNCTTLKVGNSVCLGPRCQLVAISVNETCDQILAGKTFYMNQLLSWNLPSMNLATTWT